MISHLVLIKDFPPIILLLTAVMIGLTNKNRLLEKAIFFVSCMLCIIFLMTSYYSSEYRIFQSILITILIISGLFVLQCNRRNELVALLIYSSLAISITNSSNLLTIFCLIELMMITSCYIIFSGNSESSYFAGLRYIKIHIVAGVFLLLGIMDYYQEFGENFNFAQNSFSKLELNNYRSYKHVFLLIGLLINVAMFPFSAWLPDSYPRATASGSVVLAIFTTKISILVLSRVYWGIDCLSIIGAITLGYSLIYLFLENNLRRMVCYYIIAQNSTLLIAIGFGNSVINKYFPLIISLSSLYCFFAMYVASKLYEQYNISSFTELKIGRNLKNSFWLLIIGFFLMVGFPYTISFFSEYLIHQEIAKSYLSNLISFSSIIITIATIGKLIGYIKFKDLKNLQFNFYKNIEVYLIFLWLIILGVIVQLKEQFLLDSKIMIIQIIKIFVSIYLAKVFLKFIVNKRNRLLIDIDWVYRVFLLKCYKILTTPIFLIIKWWNLHNQQILMAVYKRGQQYLSGREGIKYSSKLNIVISLLLALLLIVYY